MAEIPAAPEVATPSAVPQAAAPSNNAQKIDAPAAAVPTPAPVVPAPAPPTPVASSTPAIAEDVDVIEKEWVDKAREVVEKTAGDPHAEEEGIEDLQIDYMKKRYGKDIAKSEE
jgi:hypothetical protein